MDFLSFITGAGLVGVNAHALVALVAGLRASDAAAVARLSRRCAWSAGGLVVLSAAALAVTPRNELPRDADPAGQATRVAMSMATSMNMAAFALVGCALPLTVAAILAGYRRRLARP